MRLAAIAFTAVLMLIGCSAVEVRPVDTSLHIRHVCIQENPKVTVSDFISVLQDGFSRHDISTEVVSGTVPERCEFVLNYDAEMEWDVASYMAGAGLYLSQSGHQIGYAVKHPGVNGALSVTKWGGTKKKLDPMIDELLSTY